MNPTPSGGYHAPNIPHPQAHTQIILPVIPDLLSQVTGLDDAAFTSQIRLNFGLTGLEK